MVRERFRSFMERGKVLIRRGVRRFVNETPKFDHESYDELATEKDVYYCYRLLMGRNPDLGGWQTFNAMVGGIKVDELVSFFLTSPEFKNRDLFDKMVGKNPEEVPVLVDLGTYKQYVSPSDFAISRILLEQRVYEPHVTNALQPILQPGMTFLDIGANIGYFSLLAAKQVGAEGRIIAFEPNQYNCNLLYMSASANEFNHIDIYPFAVAETSTTFMYDNVGGSNGVISEIGNERDEEKSNQLFLRTLVRSVKLDDHLRNVERVDVIKIDIEGAEYRALLGAQQLIETHHPIIFSEFSPTGLQHVSNASGEDYLRLLVNHNYQIAILERTGQLIECGDDLAKVMSYFEGQQIDHIDIVAYLPASREVVVNR